MASPDAEARATTLAGEALRLVEKGLREHGTRAMREAVSLAPGNPRVQAAFADMQREEAIHPLLKLSHAYDTQPDEATAQDILRTIRDDDLSLAAEVVKDCIHHLFERCTGGGALGDDILSALLGRSMNARRYLTAQLDEATTDVIFEKIWKTGDGSTHELISVLLDGSIWPSETARHRCMHDVFILLIAKLMEAAQDHTGRALAELGRLLAGEAESLHPLIDADGLAVILSCFDNRDSPELRSQVTFIMARYLAASKEAGQQLLSSFITSRVAQPTNDNLVIAFTAAAHAFPIVPSTASQLFLTEGFAQSLVSLLFKKSKSTRIRQSALEMLSAAYVDPACRETINKYCRGWIEEQVKSAQEPMAGMAAVVLAKMRGAEVDQTKIIDGQDQKTESQIGVGQLVEKFRDLMQGESDEDRQRSIEGLAYASFQSSVKQELGNDASFLKNLIRLLRDSENKPTLGFGILSILVQLTRYLPNLSNEQKRMLQLKAYANTSKVKTEPDTADRDEAVTKRCQAILQANVVPAMVLVYRKVSASALAMMLKILLSLSKEQKHRGILAQQGAVKLLLQSSASTTGSSDTDKEARHSAAHALARILISVNPNLLFGSSGTPPITSAIRPLVSLLHEEDDKGDGTTTTHTAIPPNASDQRDLLPSFEALLALTNLASTDDDAIRTLIVQQAWPRIEDLLLSHHILLQRAAVELVCNLVVSPEGMAKFVVISDDDGVGKRGGDGGTGTGTVVSNGGDAIRKAGNDNSEDLEGPAIEQARARNRLHILLALADVDDMATRRAASGALAMLTDGSDDPHLPNPGSLVVDALMRHDRTISIVLGLCQDDDADIRHRGIACLRNIVGAGINDISSSSSSSAAAAVVSKSESESESESKRNNAVNQNSSGEDDGNESRRRRTTTTKKKTTKAVLEMMREQGGIAVLQSLLNRDGIDSPIGQLAAEVLKMALLLLDTT